MTDIQAWLDQGKTLAGRATEGPWEVEESSDGWTEIYGRDPIGPITPTVATTERGGEDEAAFIADARTRLPQALNALQAILDLHKPEEFDGYPYGADGVICAVCLTIYHDYEEWPCPTVRAIHDALGELS